MDKTMHNSEVGVFSRRQRVLEVAGLFLRLGATAFGGPAAHIALMHEEVVQRRKWLSEQAFLDLLGATNLIPGPNSTEMAIHLGMLRAGWLGLIVGGVCFILPAMVIVTLLAGAYVAYGTTPVADGLLIGVKPVMIAVVVKALWDLGRKAVKGVYLAGIGGAVFVLSALGVNEILLLVIGGLTMVLVAHYRHWMSNRLSSFTVGLAMLGGSIGTGVTIPAFSLSGLFWVFLKIGSVLYGSGYVLLAFMRADFVERLGWLTDQQLIDAIAIGQVTPGPVFTTATFVGYLLGGVSGGIVATVGIFLPSFVFVALIHRIIPQLRRSVTLACLLDGVNVASLALMAMVTVQLGRAALVDPFTIALALVAGGLVLFTRINTTWLVLGGALLGLCYVHMMG